MTALLAAIPAPPAVAAGSPGTGVGRAARVWRIPAVLFAIALISVTFFGDGALESFLSSYLQRTLAGACCSAASASAATTSPRCSGGSPRPRCCAASGSAASSRPRPGGRDRAADRRHGAGAAGAIGGLLLVGFAIAPVVPTTLSLAGRPRRDAPVRPWHAATAAGYGSFILSPLTIGPLLPRPPSLRLALGTLP